MSQNKLSLNAQLWLNNNGEELAGPARIELLQLIDRYGSINKAAKAMQMSYKSAWDAVDQMNRISDEPLVVRATGGKGGGGTRLTERAHQLVQDWQRLNQLHSAWLQSVAEDYPQLTESLPLIRGLALQVSARNQLHGSVAQIRPGAVNDSIRIKLPGGDQINTVITHNSCERMQLIQGRSVIALLKSPQVSVLASAPADEPGVNLLQGKITSLQAGTGDFEIGLKTAAGTTLYAVVDAAHCLQQQLAEGQTAWARFHGNQIILATLD